MKANGTASHSLVTDFLSQAHNNTDEDTMKAVAFMGYMGKSFSKRTESIYSREYGILAGLDTVSHSSSSAHSYCDVLQTASALQTFLLAMVLYPDIQACAHAEIDQVVRHDQMPCLDDRASLPYLDAILHEVLRWYPLTPLGQSAQI
jgi:hypothetical protein